MRWLRLLIPVFLLSVPLSTRADATTSLRGVGQITDGTSNTILFGYTGEASFSCADGSVRVWHPDGTVDITTAGGTTTVDATMASCDTPAGSILGTNTVDCDGSVIPAGSAGGRVACGDGSVRFLTGDGSVRFISVDVGTAGAACFPDANFMKVSDGASNTILLSESVGLRTGSGSTFAFGDGSVRTIQQSPPTPTAIDGSADARFCLGNAMLGDVLVGGITDGTSNTILIGEMGQFGACFANARFGITDGTSNTILLGETQSNVCLDNVTVADMFAATVAEPGSLGAVLVPALVALRRLRRRARHARAVLG